jgi:hypothetical protein
MKSFETKRSFVLSQYKEENLPRQIHKFNRTVYRIKGIPKIMIRAQIEPVVRVLVYVCYFVLTFSQPVGLTPNIPSE